MCSRSSTERHCFASEAFSRFGDPSALDRRLALQNRKNTSDPKHSLASVTFTRTEDSRFRTKNQLGIPMPIGQQPKGSKSFGETGPLPVELTIVHARIRRLVGVTSRKLSFEYEHDFRVLEAHFARRFGSKLLSERLPLGAGPVGPLLRPRTLRIRTALFRIRVNGIVSDPSERHCFGSE